MNKVTALISFSLLSTNLSFAADTVQLLSGERVEGTFKQATSGGVILEVAGQSLTIPLAKVKTINLGSTAQPTKSAASPSPELGELQKTIALSVAEKGFVPTDAQARRFEALLTIKCSYQNMSTKDIRAFTGAVIFQDLFGQEIYKVRVTISDPVGAGQSGVWDGTVHYNQFVQAQQRFRAADLPDLKVVWVPMSVIFSDGTRIGTDAK